MSTRSNTWQLAPPRSILLESDPAKEQAHQNLPPKCLYLWHNIDRKGLCLTIQQPQIHTPQETTTNTSHYEVLCSFNTYQSLPHAICVPGHPSIWNPGAYSQPTFIPGHDDPGRNLKRVEWPYVWTESREAAAKRADKREQNGNRIIWHARKYPFEALFRAADAMVPPAFTFNDIDVVVTRHSLRNIFDFIGNKNYKGFRFNLRLVGTKTLFVEPAEEEHTLDRGPEDLGTACERGFTKKLPHLEDTEGHYRIIRYSIGALKCAVQCEVDACYEEPSPVGTGENLAKEEILLERSHQQDPGNTGSFGIDISNCDSAEIKTSRFGCKVKGVMPQLWFGRLGWFICGRIKGPTVSWNKPRPIGDDAEAIDLNNWAIQERVNLAKLVVVLGKLRGQVQKCSGKSCVAVCPAHSTRLSVYSQRTTRGALPGDLLRRFWPPRASVSGNTQ